MKARTLFILVALFLGDTQVQAAAGHVDLDSEIEVTLRKATAEHSRLVESLPASDVARSRNSAWERFKRRKRIAVAQNEDVQIRLRPSTAKPSFKKSVVLR